MQMLYVWIGLTFLFMVLIIISIGFLIVLKKKTHAITEFKASVKGTPIALFFQDNRYVEWKNTDPDAGMVDDKQHGTFIIAATYIDKRTKNVMVPFNTAYAMSLNVKAAKLADDMTYVYSEKNEQRRKKNEILGGRIPETSTLKTLRTSVNFSTIKHFVSPLLPHNIQSKIMTTVQLRLREMGISNAPNVILLVISALGALILGGIVLKFVVFP